MSSQTKVLVTGASGYIGSHVVKQLLDAKTPVRAVARSEASITGLQKAFANELSSGLLEFAFVPEITKEGAYDEAVKGVSGVIHLAGPLANRFKGDAQKEIIEPHVNGAVGILKSATKQPSIESIVLTSSIAAHATLPRPDGVQVTDDSWNPTTVEKAIATGRAGAIYAAGKNLAEREAWKYVKTAKPRFRFSTVGPAYVGGPSILEAHTVRTGTISMVWNSATKNDASDELEPWVDVIDVAKVHVLALNKPEADGHRFLLVAPDGTVSAKQVAKIARGVKASLNSAPEPAEGTKEKIYNPINAQKILGFTYTPIEQTIRGTVEQGIRETQHHL